ncbi:6530_t:CDS:2 [Gigaspora rosea]|nr:6530_t:CDS:2 [Gigaspora rosea]
MSSSNPHIPCFNNCNCDSCNIEQLFLYKSLLESSDSRYKVLESFVLFHWSHSEFNQLHSLYSGFLSEHYLSLPEHLPFSSRFFNDSNLSSQVSFCSYNEFRNTCIEDLDYGFDNNSDNDISELEYSNIPSCEYLDDNPSFYCKLCNYPTFDCVCCWHCHYPPIECTCDIKAPKFFNCDEYNTSYCSSDDDNQINGFDSDYDCDYYSEYKYY